MTQPAFRYAAQFAAGLPEPAPPFAGLPKFNFGTGHNDPEMVPSDALAEAVARVVREQGPSLAIYNLGADPLGYAPLRQVVCDKVGRHRGIQTGPENVLITSGSLQAMDLVNTLLLQPGDTVILEDVTYSAAISKVRKMGVNFVGAPLDGGGIRIDALDGVLRGLREKGVTPKYIYTIPTVQNPTGSIMSLERRQQLLALAKDYGVPIYEDECYADVVWRPGSPPALYGLDSSQVIHIASFSKSLAPALRIGYVLADRSVLGRMLACKTDGGTAALDQMVVAEYCREHFDSHVTELSRALEDKLDVLIEALQGEFGTDVEFQRPEGGLFLWIKLPDQVDVRRLVARAAQQGLVFNAGPDVCCDPETARSHMRLCYGALSKEIIREGVARLAQVCFEETGIPARGRNAERRRGGGPA